MTQVMRLCVWMALAIGTVFAQPVGLTARELYYEGQAAPATTTATTVTKTEVATKRSPNKPGKAPRKNETVAVASSKGGAKSAQGTSEIQSVASNVASGTSGVASTGAAPTGVFVPVALRLGLRYNLLLVDDMKTGRAHEVDADGQFKAGDCFRVRLRPSRSGRMYVFNQGSSGNFSALLPSVLAPDEPVDVVANQEITIARDHCFQLDDRKGVDKLIIMITDRPEDVRELAKPLPNNPTEMQLALRVKSVFEDKARLISRDMSIQKIGNSAEDPPNSVYVVKTAAAETDRLTIEIPLRHE